MRVGILYRYPTINGNLGYCAGEETQAPHIGSSVLPVLPESRNNGVNGIHKNNFSLKRKTTIPLKK
jgi:hypothetical protein